MDVVALSRIQFALTISFHFIFPAVTIGLAGLIAIVETFRWWTKKDVYDRLSVFMTKLFAVTFVIGVVSGVVMEFQFGTNWSRFSGYVGDIFGAPLAAEGIFAFFLESAFVGIVLFGRDRVTSTVRWIAGLLVALGTTLSAFFILVANSWMQTPAGYKLVTENGVERAQMTNFFDAAFNPSTLPRFMHTMAACWVAGAFFLMGIAAWYTLRGRGSDVSRIALRLSMVVAFLMAGGMFATGDLQTREVQANQPVKFAVMEGICKTENGAALTIIALPPDQSCSANAGGLGIPKGLSAMSNFDPNSAIVGLENVDPKFWPPIATTFMSFHMMVALGTAMMLIMFLGIFFLWRGTLEKRRWWLALAVISIPMPIAAIELGWATAEVGRQPWIVQGLMLTSHGTSPGVGSGDVAISIFAILGIYTLLFALWIYGLTKEIRRGPELAAVAVGPAAAVPAVSGAAVPDTAATPAVSDPAVPPAGPDAGEGAK